MIVNMTPCRAQCAVSTEPIPRAIHFVAYAQHVLAVRSHIGKTPANLVVTRDIKAHE